MRGGVRGSENQRGERMREEGERWCKGKRGKMHEDEKSRS